MMPSNEWRGFRARYNGVCSKCKGAVRGRTATYEGDPVRWSKRQRGVIYHAACFSDSPSEPQPVRDTAPEQEVVTEQPTTEPMLPRERDAMSSSLDDAKVATIAIREANRLDDERAKAHMDAMRKLTEEVNRKLASERTLTVHITRDEAPAVVIANAHKLVGKLLQVIRGKRHAYLYGPPGSGKSKAAQQVSEALGMRYGYISLNPQTPESRLLGFIDAGGHYRRTVFRDCFEHGGVFCIDEGDNAHPALLNTLNGMVEPGANCGAFPDGVITRHADFVLIMTGNTNGRGGDVLFPERRALDAAFAERFVFLYWEYDEALEQALTLAHGPKNGMVWLKWVRNVRAYCKAHGIRLWATPRAAMTGAMFLDTLDWTPREVADAVLFKGIDADTVDRILSAHALPAAVA